MTEVGLETLQNWRLTEAEIDGFCHFWYDGIVGQHGDGYNYTIGDAVSL